MPFYLLIFGRLALNYLKDIGLQVLSKELSHLRIPDLSGTADSPVGKIDWSLTGITLTEVNFGRSSVTINAGIGITLRM